MIIEMIDVATSGARLCRLVQGTAHIGFERHLSMYMSMFLSSDLAMSLWFKRLTGHPKNKHQGCFSGGFLKLGVTIEHPKQNRSFWRTTVTGIPRTRWLARFARLVVVVDYRKRGWLTLATATVGHGPRFTKEVGQSFFMSFSANWTLTGEP